MPHVCGPWAWAPCLLFLSLCPLSVSLVLGDGEARQTLQSLRLISLNTIAIANTISSSSSSLPDRQCFHFCNQRGVIGVQFGSELAKNQRSPWESWARTGASSGQLLAFFFFSFSILSFIFFFLLFIIAMNSVSENNENGV